MNYVSTPSRRPSPMIGKMALLVDFDGTLIELAAKPDDITVPPAVPALLEGLKNKMGGALAVISGRRIKDLDRLLAPLRFAASGCLGAEIRLEPHDDVQALATPLPHDVVQRLRHFASQLPGVYFENKIYGICLHFQDASAMRNILEKRLPALLATSKNKIRVLFTKKGCEIKKHDLNKGDAVKNILMMPTFINKMPIYIGDGILDREAFSAVRALGGISICVGDKSAFPEASFALPSVKAVHKWLEGVRDGNFIPR